MGSYGPITNSAGAAGGSGTGGERLADAVARRHRAVAFRAGDGEAQRAQGLDDPARRSSTFSLSLLGTFLVRSGVLTSVHTFASDPLRGIFILVILVIFIGGGLSIFAWRAPLLKQGGLFAPVSREGRWCSTISSSSTACATVVVGTLYPLALEALTGAKISVGAPYFNLTFGPLFIPLLFAMPFGPLLAWKRGDLPGGAQRLAGCLRARPRRRYRRFRHCRRGPFWRRSGSVLPSSSLPARSPTSSSAPTSCACRRVSQCAVSPACRGRSGVRRSRIWEWD